MVGYPPRDPLVVPCEEVILGLACRVHGDGSMLDGEPEAAVAEVHLVRGLTVDEDHPVAVVDPCFVVEDGVWVTRGIDRYRSGSFG